MQPIYLDYNATTPVDPGVYEAMLPYLRDHFGNPSSSHGYGKIAHEAVDRARRQVAELLHARLEEIVLTGGGSEASNHAIKGVVFNQVAVGKAFQDVHVITSAIEHPATLQPCEFLKKLGCSVTILPVDGTGRVDPDAVRRSICTETVLISIMHSNNEVGTLQPIKEIAAIAREMGIWMHTDAAQSMGKLDVDVKELGVDLLTVAGHKLYAPKGIGVLFIRDGVRVEKLIHGAGHEAGRRAGTENVPYIVGLGAAAAIARRSLPQATEKLKALRDRLENQLRQHLGEQLVLNGHRELRLPNTLNVSFLHEVGSELLARTPEVAASTGSACHEGRIKLSPVLAAMGVSPEIGQGAVRLSVGRFTTEEDVDRAAQALYDSTKRR